MKYNDNVIEFVNTILDLTWFETDGGVWLFVATPAELAVIDTLIRRNPALPDQAIAWQEDRITSLEAEFEVAKATFEVRVSRISPLAAEYREEAQRWEAAVAAASRRHETMTEELELLRAFNKTLK